MATKHFLRPCVLSILKQLLVAYMPDPDFKAMFLCCLVLTLCLI